LAILKRPYLFDIVNKIKLWPSRKGVLHGVKEVENLGAFIRISTHCGRIIMAKQSRRSKAARWLRNRWTKTICSRCDIPDWKIERFRKSVSKCAQMQKV